MSWFWILSRCLCHRSFWNPKPDFVDKFQAYTPSSLPSSSYWTPHIHLRCIVSANKLFLQFFLTHYTAPPTTELFKPAGLCYVSSSVLSTLHLQTCTKYCRFSFTLECAWNLPTPWEPLLSKQPISLTELLISLILSFVSYKSLSTLLEEWLF